jgi:hypothetical protein
MDGLWWVGKALEGKGHTHTKVFFFVFLFFANFFYDVATLGDQPTKGISQIWLSVTERKKIENILRILLYIFIIV